MCPDSRLSATCTVGKPDSNWILHRYTGIGNGDSFLSVDIKFSNYFDLYGYFGPMQRTKSLNEKGCVTCIPTAGIQTVVHLVVVTSRLLTSYLIL